MLELSLEFTNSGLKKQAYIATKLVRITFVVRKVSVSHSNWTLSCLQRLHFLVRDWGFPYEIPYGHQGGQQLLDDILQVSSTCFEKLHTCLHALIMMALHFVEYLVASLHMPPLYLTYDQAENS